MASSATPEDLQALVFGASGVGGWAILHNALSYPTPTAFKRIIGLARRPLTKATALLPLDDPRLELVSGLDLARGVESVIQTLKGINGIEGVTHVYFAAYTAHRSDPEELQRANVEILENAIKAVEQVCPNVHFWTLQTGGKTYGIEFFGQIPLYVPFKESQPRIPEPFASKIFYYSQVDLLARSSVGKKWKYTEIRPDAIIGFVPHNNGMSLGQALAVFLSIQRTLHPGETVPFPGPPASYTALHSDSPQDLLARFHLWASLHPDKTHGRAFNITEGAVSWADVWAGICGYFGLVGVGPVEGEPGKASGAEWVMQHRAEWDMLEETCGLKKGVMEGTAWDFMHIVMQLITFDRQYDQGAVREVGFLDSDRDSKEETIKGFRVAFDRMREAGIIP